jgi:hypothetical protein
MFKKIYRWTWRIFSWGKRRDIQPPSSSCLDLSRLRQTWCVIDDTGVACCWQLMVTIMHDMSINYFAFGIWSPLPMEPLMNRLTDIFYPLLAEWGEAVHHCITERSCCRLCSCDPGKLQVLLPTWGQINSQLGTAQPYGGGETACGLFLCVSMEEMLMT